LKKLGYLSYVDRKNIEEGRIINTLNSHPPFWKTTQLQDMTKAQWESLCDGCGRCCLVKLEDEDTSKILYTDVTCTLLDANTCRCMDYSNRQNKVPECVNLTPKKVKSLSWLPKTCAYRLVAEGKDLCSWHPLVSGSVDTVHEAGISVRGRTCGSEDGMTIEEQITRIVKWPNQWPKSRA
jgi:uncharacterized protein